MIQTICVSRAMPPCCGSQGLVHGILGKGFGGGWAGVSSNYVLNLHLVALWSETRPQVRTVLKKKKKKEETTKRQRPLIKCPRGAFREPAQRGSRRFFIWIKSMKERLKKKNIYIYIRNWGSEPKLPSDVSLCDPFGSFYFFAFSATCETRFPSAGRKVPVLSD